MKLVFLFIIVAFLHTSGAWAQAAESQGLQYFESGNFKSAIMTLREEVKSRPAEAKLWSRLGLSYLKDHDVKQAIEALDKAISIDSTDAFSYIGRGYANLLLGEFGKASEAGREAVKLDPKRSEGYYIMGMASFDIGNYEGASEFATKSIDTDASFNEAYLLRAQCLTISYLRQSGTVGGTLSSRSGMLRSAASDLSKYLVLTPSDSKSKRDAQEFLESLNYFADYYSDPANKPPDLTNGLPPPSDPGYTPVKVEFVPRASAKSVPMQVGVAGQVKLLIGLGADGKVRHILVLQPLPYGLTQAAIDSAKGIKFQPAVKNGKPVNSVRMFFYNFDVHADGFPRQ